jgi:hypothetical protein
MRGRTTDDLNLDISNDKIDQIRQSAIRAAIKGVLSGKTAPAIGLRDLCMTPILKSNPNPTCSAVKLSGV